MIAASTACQPDHHLMYPSENVQYLNDDEINEFIDHVDSANGDGYIYYRDVKQRLDEAHDELVQQPNAYHIPRHNNETRDCHVFLRNIMGGADRQRIPRDEFARLVREWKIPSLGQVRSQEEEEQGYFYFKSHSGWRKIRAYWAVHGLEVVFIGLVASILVGSGVWQLLKYRTSPYIDAFGPGLTVAKTCSGALYPTFFCLVLSTFHMRIACVALVLTTIHVVGHLTGTFIHGSDPTLEEAVTNIIGPHKIGHHRHYYYSDYIRSVPGFTGLAGFGLFLVISLLSIPLVRRWNYNVFQLGHLLVYPFIGLMAAHGTSSLLQRPLLGYFLAFPAVLVICERLSRLISGFNRMEASVEVLDDDTVEVAVLIPKRRPWDYTAGQYILMQVPEISFFQWHPFTISLCHGKRIVLHIKTDGDWTSKLRQLGPEIKVGINGPFGAPSQRFHDFKYSIIIGSGIGITPFSAILADLQHSNDVSHGGPGQRDVCYSDSDASAVIHQKLTRSQSDSWSLQHQIHPGEVRRPSSRRERKPRSTLLSPGFNHTYRRTDFHWIVRDGNCLLWLSDLLNKVCVSQKWHHEHDEHSHLDIHINTHVTAKRNYISTHVYSCLLEMDRTEEHPASSLTGLLNATSFGRPDFDKIFDRHYEEMRRVRRESEGSQSSKGKGPGSSGHCKVGVFYCGAAAVGVILADKCSELTVRGRNDGSKIEYHFMIEVFG